MKKLLRTRPVWLLVLSPLLAAFILTFGYAAIAKWRDANVPQSNSMASVSSMPQPVDLTVPPNEDEDPEQRQRRAEYLKRFYGTGPGQVSYADFAASLAAASALPPSPLLGGERSKAGDDEVPTETQPWTYPLSPPLWNFWSTGGASVRIDAIAVHPTNPDIVYVGSEGGLAKSTDGGDHWTYLSDDLSSQSIRSIAIDPSAPNIVYAGTGFQFQFGVGLFRSFDSGATWDLLGKDEFTGSVICKIAIDPTTAGSESATTVYASVVTSGTHTLWQSDDSGKSWDIVRGPVTWPGNNGFPFFDIAVDSSGWLYFTAPDGVFGRNPGGSVGQIHDIHPNASSYPSFLALDNQSAVYLAYRDSSLVTKISKSTNHGGNWVNINDPGSDLYCFGVDPANPSRIFVGGYPNGTVYDLRYTLNGGISWLNAGGLHPDMHVFAFCPTNPSNGQRYYLGNDGGIYRANVGPTPPPSISWVSKNQNLPGILTQGVSISRDDRVFIGTQDNANQRYRPASPPWAPINPGNGQGGALLSGDGARGFIEFENNTEKIYAFALLYPTVVPNIGAPARIINDVATSVTPPGAIGEYTALFPAMSVQFKVPANSDRVIMGFQHVWRSTDSGNNWTRIGGTPCPTPTPSGNCGLHPGRVITAVCEAPSDSNYIYAVINYGEKIYKTANANSGTSATWLDITRNLSGSNADGISNLACHPTDPQTVYLAGNRNVHKTANGGTTDWVAESVGPNFIFRDVVFHPADPTRIFVATHRGVYARVNGNWGSMSNQLPKGMAYWYLSFNQHSHQLAAAAYGRGVYAIDLDRVPPTAAINFPANGAHVRGTITVLGTALDNHKVASHQFKLDGANLGGGGGGDLPDTPTPNVSVNWNTGLSTGGNHVLTLLVHDAYGTPTTSAGVTVTIDNSAPTVSITEPENDKEVKGMVTIMTDAADNIGVAGVQFYVDGIPFGDEVTSAPFKIDWDTSELRNGAYTLVAVARDAAGNTTTSDPVTVTTTN